MTQKTKETPYGEDAPAMDQVRELLFGAQIKDMDIRLQRQSERFDRAVEDTKSAMKNRMDTLENFMKSEVSSLLARVKEEQSERTEEIKIEQRERQANFDKLTEELVSASDATDRKLAKLIATLDTTERELRQLLLTENHALSEKIDEKYQVALGTLRSTAEQIRFDMVHRSSLASMFTETALKLNGQWSAEMEQGSVSVAPLKSAQKKDAS